VNGGFRIVAFPVWLLILAAIFGIARVGALGPTADRDQPFRAATRWHVHLEHNGAPLLEAAFLHVKLARLIMAAALTQSPADERSDERAGREWAQ